MRITTPLRIPILEMDPKGYERQVARLDQLRKERDNTAVQRALDDLRRSAEGTDNLMPCFLEAARAYATLGEITDVLRQEFGLYQEKQVI